MVLKVLSIICLSIMIIVSAEIMDNEEGNYFTLTQVIFMTMLITPLIYIVLH